MSERGLPPTVWMLTAIIFLSLNDVMLRLLGGALPAGQIIALRGVFVVLILLVAVVFLGMRWPRRAEFLHPASLLRGVGEAGANLLFVSSLQVVPLGLATMAVFTYPIMLNLAAARLFGDRPGRTQWLMVGIGFVGVAMVAGPAWSSVGPAILLPLSAALVLMLRDTATRHIPRQVPTLCVVLTSSVAGTLAGFATLPLGWAQLEPTHLLMLPVAAAFFTMSVLGYVLAVQRGRITVLGPIQYLVIPLALLWGLLIWHEQPEPQVLLGAAVICLSGLPPLFMRD